MRLLKHWFVLWTMAMSALASDAEIVRVDHYVPVKSTVPFMEGQTAQIYVREVVEAGQALRGDPDGSKVVLFVHGAGTPAEVAFDVPYQDFSWMAYLAAAGYDTFSMDMTGYGRSTRPTPMNDPCNLSEAQYAQLFPDRQACDAGYPANMTTIASDWHDIDTVVDHLRQLRGVEQVNLVAWSLGGPRAGGYAAQHPEKVRSLVVLAPAYNRNTSTNPPDEVPRPGSVMTKQSRLDFINGWERQAPCEGQYTAATRDSIWAEMLASDPVGATWGPGVRRAPSVTNWGFSQERVGQMTTPFLMIAGVHDGQVNPDRVSELYDDVGSEKKVFIDLGCSSHNAMWEVNHLILFEATREWLETGTVQGEESGRLKLGY